LAAIRSERTAVAFVGKVTWTVKLRKTGTLRFRCDPHSRSKRGTKKIV
jgi:hypothetical protein